MNIGHFFILGIVFIFFSCSDDEPVIEAGRHNFFKPEIARPKNLPKEFSNIDNSCSVESSVMSENRKLKISGWAGDVVNGTLLKSVIIELRGSTTIYATQFDVVKRDDVMKRYNQPTLIDSGWDFFIDLSEIKVGSYEIRVIRSEDRIATSCFSKVSVVIK